MSKSINILISQSGMKVFIDIFIFYKSVINPDINNYFNYSKNKFWLISDVMHVKFIPNKNIINFYNFSYS